MPLAERNFRRTKDDFLNKLVKNKCLVPVGASSRNAVVFRRLREESWDLFKSSKIGGMAVELFRKETFFID